MCELVGEKDCVLRLGGPSSGVTLLAGAERVNRSVVSEASISGSSLISSLDRAGMSTCDACKPPKRQKMKCMPAVHGETDANNIKISAQELCECCLVAGCYRDLVARAQPFAAEHPASVARRSSNMADPCGRHAAVCRRACAPHGPRGAPATENFSRRAKTSNRYAWMPVARVWNLLTAALRSALPLH